MLISGKVLSCALAAYYLCAWFLVGRKPRRQAAVVRYEPPPGLSPAAARYVFTMGCDGRTLAAILAQLSARRVISISPGKDAIYLKDLTNDGIVPHGLPAEEEFVFRRLVRWNGPVRLEKPDRELVSDIEMALKSGPCARYFNRHFGWMTAGFLAAGAAASWEGAATGVFGPGRLENWLVAAMTGVTVAVLAMAGAYMWGSNLQAVRLSLRGLYRRRTVLLLLALVLLFPAMWYLLVRTTEPEFGAFTLSLILISTFAAPALTNYTAEGREALAQALSFRQFLQTAEQDRLDRLNPAGREAQADEQYLPYAIALDVREGWGDDLGIRAMAETAF